MNDNAMSPECFAARFAPDGPATITGYLIDVYNETASVVTIPKTREGYLAALDCRCIDMVDRQIGVRCLHNRRPRRYEIICDDEALMKSPAKISAIDNMGDPMLCGNLFIVKLDDDGEASLDDSDIEYLRRYILKQGTRKFPRPYFMLHQCEL